MVFSLVIWSLVVFGITNGINSGGVFTPTWNWLCTRDSWLMNKLGELFSCPKCLGFWVAGLVSMFLEGPAGNAWTAFDIGLGPTTDTLLMICNMFIGSAVCCLLAEWCREKY